MPQGPILLCANHRSHLDGAAIGLASGRRPDDVALFVAADYFFDDKSWLRRVPLPCRLLPVNRNHGNLGLEDLERGGRTALADGVTTLIVFPEGTRTHGHKTRPFRRGAAIIAAQLGLPMVPTRVEGTARSLPRGSVFPRPATVSVRFGSAIMPPKSETVTPQHLRRWSKHATHEIERRVASMRSESSPYE